MFLGYLISVFSFIGVFFFSLFLFWGDSLIFSWLSLELATLCLVPSFFSLGGCNLSSLFSYLVVSGISSGFIVLGLLFPDLLGFILLGFIIKFGVFPFMSWVYDVVSGSNWLVIFGFSLLLKSSFFIVCFFLGGISLNYVLFLGVLCCFTLGALSFLFWVYSFSWRFCWCHMMLSSSCVLLLMSLFISLETLSWFFVCYFIWGSFCVFYFYLYDSYENYSIFFVGLFVFLLLSTPLSFSLFYKLFIVFNLFSCSTVVFLFWVFYSLSEQFYLFKYICSFFIPKKLGSLSLVV